MTLVLIVAFQIIFSKSDIPPDEERYTKCFAGDGKGMYL